ncbi:MAG: HAMP domain-containing sensor histidine kinase [Myxococcota bacterium]
MSESPPRPSEADPIEEDRVAALLLVSSGVAHEVLNPLGFVSMALFQLRELFDAQALSPEAQGEAARLFDAARVGLDRVQGVVSDLRSYALRETSPKPALADLHEGLRRTARLLTLRRGDAVRVHLDLGPDGRAVCREGRMNQVFFNLILNALQAVGDSGDVWVKSLVDENRLCVSVRDSGPGIPPENLGRLFRPFFTTKEGGQASGLGLALSRRIVRDHGGDIHVRSDPSSGAELTVTIPRGI